MIAFFGWRGGSDETRIARGRFKDALTLQFNRMYGTDVDDITSWQRLFRVLNVDPTPEGLEECRRVSEAVLSLCQLITTLGSR